MGTMRLLLTSALALALSCSSEPVETGSTPSSEDSPEPPEENSLGYGIEVVESNPDIINGNYLLDPNKIHHFAIEMDADAQNSLNSDPRTYAGVTVITEGQRLSVGMRLKGNSTYQDFSGKPSIKISFDYVVDDQVLYGLESLNFHGNVLDASMLHEPLAFYIYREAGLAAARTGWATLEINGTDYGIYTLSEVQDEVFLEQWWKDTSGSVYEAGSFEGSCDLSDGGCDCFEQDRVGDGDSIEDLQALCAAATSSDDWYGGIQNLVDWEPWLRTMAMDMILAHWDDYGFNVNNYRIYHEPTEDLWYFTSWSTDLAFGWNPWGGAWCGEYGTWPADHSRGYLLSRCWSTTECKTDLLQAMSDMNTRFENMDLLEEIQRVHGLISDEKYEDPRHPWNTDQFEAEFNCLESWVQTRPASIRSFIESQG